MAETLKRHREGAAWLVLLVSIGYILMSLVRGGWLLGQGQTVGAVARTLGGSSLSVVLSLAVLAVAMCCVLVRPATDHARRIVRTGALVVTAAAVLQLLFTGLGLPGARGGIVGRTFDVVGAALEVALKLGIATLLWRAVAAAPEPADQGQPEVAPTSSIELEPIEAEEEVQAASWKAEQAVGAVWTRAGDAASGAAASGWGKPGAESKGWSSEQAQAGLGVPELELPQTTRGPWSTAGALADDRPDEPQKSLPHGNNAPAKAGEVSWQPAPRN